MGAQQISRDIVVDAPPSAVFAVLADPGKHAGFDGSGMVRGSVAGPDRLSLGSTFGMSMRWGLPYSIRNTVVEFEEDRRIAWCHAGRHRWRYELEAADGGTRVTETFDWSTALSPRVIELLGWRERASRAIERTLPRLKARVETPAR